MNPKLKKSLKIIIPLLVGIGLVWYSLLEISVDELLVYFKNADYSWIALGLVLGFLSHISRAYRWLFMVEPLGYKVKFLNSAMAVFTTYLVNYTIPRAGEVARATVLQTYEGVPFEKGIGTIVAERVADLLVMALIITVALFLQFDYIYAFFAERFDPIKIALMAGGVVFLLVAFLIYIKRSKSKFAQKVKKFAKGLIEGALSIFKMEKKWAFIFHTFFIWAMYLLMFYVTAFSVDELDGIPFGAILIGFISASFSIAATNGGIGSYPVAVYAAFAIFGIAKEPSIAFGYIMWSSQTLMIFICGGLSFLFLPIYNRKK